MIPRKYEFIIFSFLMSLFMSILMSGFITFINIGFVKDFLLFWLKASGEAFILAFPVTLFLVPQIRKFVNMIVV